MPRPCVSSPVAQHVYVRSPGREQMGPQTPGFEEPHTPRVSPPGEEEVVVATPKESNNPRSCVIELGSEATGSNGGYFERGMASVNQDVLAHCQDRNFVLDWTEEHLASVQGELIQHHHAMVECLHKHRQAISNMVWASLNGHPVDLSANAVNGGTPSSGFSPGKPVSPRAQLFGKSTPSLKSSQPQSPKGAGFKGPNSLVTEITPGGSLIAKHEIDGVGMNQISSTHSALQEASNGIRRKDRSRVPDSPAQGGVNPTPSIRQSIDDLNMMEPWDLDVRSNATINRTHSRRLDIVFGGANETGTPILDLSIGVLIMLNALVLCLFSQWEGYQAAIKLGKQQPDDGWLHAKTVFTVFEHFFCIVFLVEFCLRIRWLGWGYWKDAWNDFDAFLVFTSAIELYILQNFSSGSGTNLTLLRLARIFKLVKVFRVVRVLKMFGSLRILTKTMAASFASLATSMVLLGIIMCLGGIFMVQTLIENINDESLPYDLRAWAYKYYGTSVRGMYTMFEVTMSGCWPNYARRTIDEISPYYGIFWVVYVSFVVFAVLRIITAIFLKHTLDNAGSDADLLIAAQMQKKRAYVEKLGEAFEAIDESGDGTITRKEFHEIISHPKVRAYLAVLDLEIHETSSLFDLLEDDNDGVITYKEFLDGVYRLKGQARTLDIVEIQRNMKRLLSCVYAVCDAMDIMGKVSRRL